MEDKQLTTNFKLSEFVCPCCGKGENYLFPALYEGLQKLRDLAGLPITVLSGYRCSEHNKAVGGASDSYHVKGMAADIQFSTRFNGQVTSVIDMFLLAEEINRFRDGGIGIYPHDRFIHVDVRSLRARWVRIKGKYISIPQWIKG